MEPQYQYKTPKNVLCISSIYVNEKDCSSQVTIRINVLYYIVL